MWNIVFYNDDYTSIEFVVFILTRVFHKSTEDALALTFAVRQGRNPARPDSSEFHSFFKVGPFAAVWYLAKNR
jgi:hypothetical protein